MHFVAIKTYFIQNFKRHISPGYGGVVTLYFNLYIVFHWVKSRIKKPWFAQNGDTFSSEMSTRGASSTTVSESLWQENVRDFTGMNFLHFLTSWKSQVIEMFLLNGTSRKFFALQGDIFSISLKSFFGVFLWRNCS